MMPSQWVVIHRWPFNAEGSVAHTLMPDVYESQEAAVKTATFYNDHDKNGHDYFVAAVNSAITITSDF